MVSFDGVVDAYEAARPAYPDAAIDALGPVDGALVVDGGAGTGILTRALLARGAEVVALDIGEQMVRRCRGHRAVADAARSPLRSGCADLVCFGQSWHWLDHTVASTEVARLLRPGGRWAGLWNHARADGEGWFEAYFDLIESTTVGRRAHRDTDWGATLDRSLFDEPVFTSVEWVREVPLDVWLTDDRSKSYIGLTDEADEIMREIERILRAEFGDGPVRVRYATWVWTSQRVATAGSSSDHAEPLAR